MFLRAAVVSLLGLCPAVYGQQWFLDARKSPLPLQMAETKALFAGDLNGDQLPDLLVSNPRLSRGGRIFVELGSWFLLNRGSGRFENVTPPPLDPGVQQLLLGLTDIDGDGDLDGLFQRGVALNDGLGGLAYLEEPSFDGWRAAIGDLDGDGLPEVFTGHTLYLNQGGLVFIAVDMGDLVPLSLTEVPALGLADLDGDGDGDLVVGHTDGRQTQLLINHGSGVFTDETATRMPTDSDDTRALLVMDVEGDGDPDLVLANHGAGVRVYLNSGAASFTRVAETPPYPDDAISLSAGDVDGDGDLDLAVGLESGGRILLNQGDARFQRAPKGSWEPGTQPSSAVLLEDLDGDGDLDLVQGTGRNPMDPSGNGGSFGLENCIYFNDGSGKFLATLETLPTVLRDPDIAGGDLDGDGDLDLLVTGSPGGLLLNDGWGTYRHVDLRLPVSGRPLLGDLDGDGDLDALVLEVAGGIHVLDNPGDGMLWPQRSYWLPPLPVEIGIRAGALGDLDGDGDLDLFAVTGTSSLPFPQDVVAPDSIWLNDGTGQFARGDHLLPARTTNCREIVLGDIDGDGDLDAVTDGWVLYRREPEGFTTEPLGIAGNWGETHLALADLDDDGDLDLVAGNGCSGMGCAPSGDGGPNAIHWNDGSGGFAQSELISGTGATLTESTVVGDVDGDGDPDIIFGNRGDRNTPENMLFLNQGAGVFVRATGTFPDSPFPVDWDDTFALILADTDSDGDPDLVVVNGPVDPAGSPRSKIYVNLTRHLRAPYLARPGHSYPLQVYGAEYGAVIYAAWDRTRDLVPPFGTVGLDPRSIVPVAILAPPATGRRVDFEIHVPLEPSLVGLTVYFQAVVLAPVLSDSRLTNLLEETVLPF